MARLSEIAYWVGMGKDVGYYCSHCTTCQITKAPPNQPAPLQPIVASRPWELVAVDILKVPLSSTGNQYLLVIQRLFFKMAFCNPATRSKGRKNSKSTEGPSFHLSGTTIEAAL